jgi:hypothetical protein
MIETDEIRIGLAVNPRGTKRGASAILTINGTPELVRLPPGKRVLIDDSQVQSQVQQRVQKLHDTEFPGAENAK